MKRACVFRVQYQKSGSARTGLTCQMALELKLIETLIVEAAEFRGHPTEGPDETELPSDDVNDEAEPRFRANSRPFSASGCTSASGSPAAKRFVTHLVAAVRGKCKVTDPVGDIEGATHQIAAGPGMFRHGITICPKDM